MLAAFNPHNKTTSQVLFSLFYSWENQGPQFTLKIGVIWNLNPKLLNSKAFVFTTLRLTEDKS